MLTALLGDQDISIASFIQSKPLLTILTSLIKLLLKHHRKQLCDHFSLTEFLVHTINLTVSHELLYAPLVFKSINRERGFDNIFTLKQLMRCNLIIVFDLLYMACCHNMLIVVNRRDLARVMVIHLDDKVDEPIRKIFSCFAFLLNLRNHDSVNR